MPISFSCRSGALAALVVAIAFLLPAAARAADPTFPDHPMTIVVPWGPGGSGDITGRAFGRFLEKQVGQPAVIENKPGANGIIGSEFVKRAAPDGYTMMIVSNMTHAANSTLYKKLPYDPLKDFQHVGLFGVFGLLALVPPNSPFKSIPELKAYAQAHPRQVAIGYSNASTQVAAQVLASDPDLPVNVVGYKEIGSAVTDVLGGHIQMLFVDYPAAANYLKSGKLVAIATTEKQRNPQWPDLPTVAEVYPGYEIVTSLGLAVPTGTPQARVDQLNALVVQSLSNPEMKAQLEQLGYTLRPISADATRGFLVSESDRWARYIKAAKIEPQ